MSDDPTRPASGPQSDPHPAADAPAWWGALGRVDLPLDSEASAPAAAGIAPPAHTAPQRVARTWRPPLWWRSLAFNASVLVIALLIVCVGVGVVSPSMFLTVAVIFGVPLTLTAVTVAIIVRRSR